MGSAQTHVSCSKHVAETSKQREGNLSMDKLAEEIKKKRTGKGRQITFDLLILMNGLGEKYGT